MARPTLPLSISHRSGQTPAVLLDGKDITRFIAANGLSIDYDHADSSVFGPTVKITFGIGALDLDLDIDLLEDLLTAAKAAQR